MIKKPDYVRTLNTKKFKSDVLSYYYILDLNPANATYANLLANVLLSGSQSYPDISSIAKRQQELYGTRVNVYLSTFGRYLVLVATALYPSEKFLPDSQLSYHAKEFLEDLLYKPLAEKEKFQDAIFLREKENLQVELENLVKDLPLYCYRKCIELTYGDHDLGTYKYGDLKILQNITSEELYKFYRKIVDHSPFYVFSDENTPEKIQGKMGSPLVMEEAKLIHRQVVKETQSLEAFQSVMTQSYFYKGPQGEKEAYPVQLLNSILGGGANSLLFREVREEMGYCYYISTNYDRFLQLMTLNVGFDGQNLEPMLAMIEDLMGRVAKGEILPKDLESAKSEFIRQLKTFADDQMQQIGYRFVRDAFSLHSSIEQRMEEVKKVSMEQVVQAAKNLHLQAQYVIKGFQNESM